MWIAVLSVSPPYRSPAPPRLWYSSMASPKTYVFMAGGSRASGEVGAAIGVDIGTCHERGIVADQPGDGRGDLFRVALPPQRGRRGDVGAHFVLGESVVKGGRDHAGAQRVDADALGPK